MRKTRILIKHMLLRVIGLLLSTAFFTQMIPLVHLDLSASASESDRYTIMILDASYRQGFNNYDHELVYTADSAIEQVKVAAADFIEKLMNAGGNNYVAVIRYGSYSETVSEFTDNVQSVNRKVLDLNDIGGGANMNDALVSANNMLDGITDTKAEKNVVIVSTGNITLGDYSHEGHYSEDTIGSGWHFEETGIHNYEYANVAYDTCAKIKKKAKVYSLGLFNRMENIPESESYIRDIAEFFKLTARELATSDEYFFCIDDVDDNYSLPEAFDEVHEDITKEDDDYQQGLNILTNEPSRSVRVGTSFLVGATVKDKNGNAGDLSGIRFSVEDKDKFITGDVFELSGALYCRLTAIQAGTTKIKISDEITGQTGEVEFTITMATGNAYTVYNVPCREYFDQDGGIMLNIVNSGLYIDNFDKKIEKNGDVSLSFNVYNTLFTYGIIEVYNSKNELINCKLIKKMSYETSIKDTIESGWNLIKTIKNIIGADYRLSSRSAENVITNMKVPKGGYVKICNDPTQSTLCALVNSIDIVFQFKHLAGDIKSINEDKLAETTIEKLQKYSDDFIEDVQKGFSKAIVNKFIDSDNDAISFASTLNDLLTNDKYLSEILTDVLKDSSIELGADAAEKWFVSKTNFIGLTLEGMFTANKGVSALLSATHFARRINNGCSVKIEMPYLNKRVCSNVTVECKMDDDVALDVYMIDPNELKKYLPPIEAVNSQNISKNTPQKDNHSAVDIISGYDISLWENGKEYNPKDKVKVIIPIPDKYRGQEGNMSIYRVEPTGEITKIDGVSDGKYITFFTDHFSEYVLAASGIEKDKPETQPGQTIVRGDTIVSEWAVVEVDEAFEQDLVPDILRGEDLTKKVDRAEFAAIAVNLYEKLSGNSANAATNPFGDISGNYCEEDILKAYNLGITAGVTNITFEPNALIPREQVATMLTRAYKKSEFNGWTLATDSDFPLNFMGVQKYADDDEISDYAKESVYFMTRWDILKGVDDSHFAPKNNVTLGESYGFATREQAVVIALRSVKHL